MLSRVFVARGVIEEIVWMRVQRLRDLDGIRFSPLDVVFAVDSSNFCTCSRSVILRPAQK